MTLNQRVLNHLINDGAMTEQHVTRTPRTRHCRTCRRAVIAAINDLNLETTIDPRPLTPLGELQAITAGLRTYTNAPWGELIYRGTHRINAHPANTEPVHPAHSCEMPPLQYAPTQKKPRAANARDIPPPY